MKTRASFPGLGALRNRLADADPGSGAAARVERDAEALCEGIRNDLKSHRVALGVSQKELAERLELSQPAISKIESGRGDLSIKMVYRLADALGPEIRSRICACLARRAGEPSARGADFDNAGREASAR